jgi:hypothetical protein
LRLSVFVFVFIKRNVQTRPVPAGKAEMGCKCQSPSLPGIPEDFPGGA